MTVSLFSETIPTILSCCIFIDLQVNPHPSSWWATKWTCPIVRSCKGHAKAKEWGASFLETSAKTRVSVPRVHPIVKSVLLLSMSCIVVKIVVISHV